MNETLFDQINTFARDTSWLHPVLTTYAGDGVVVFALLLGAGWWSARRRGEPRRMAASACAGVATLLAVGVNQPIVAAVHEARPYIDHPDALVRWRPSPVSRRSRWPSLGCTSPPTIRPTSPSGWRSGPWWRYWSTWLPIG
jgi:hypothetical protein